MGEEVKVLVTGAAGFIGSHTVDRLLADGCRVLGVDDLSTGRRENLEAALESDRFELAVADVSAKGAVAGLAESFQPDAIVHLAALVSVPRGEEEPALNHRLNVTATQEVAEAARLAKVSRVVFASSAAVYGDSEELPLTEDENVTPISQYGMAKLVGEKVLDSYRLSYGVDSVCFRFFNVFGPRQDPGSPYSGVVSIFMDRARAGNGVTVFGDGTQSRDFIYVGDVAGALAEAAVGGVSSGVYNLCTGRSSTLLDLLEVLRGEFPEFPEPEFGEPRAGDIKHSLGSPALLEARTGYRAETPVAEGLKALLASL